MKGVHLVLAALLLALAARARAGLVVDSILEIGPHYRVLTVKKSIHPQNTLVAYTRLDGECRVERDPKRANRPAFDFYWLMDGKRYKPVNRLLLRGIRKRLEIGASPPKSRDGSFSVRLNQFKEVRHDLGPTPMLWVRAERTPKGCSVQARMTLGPSNRNEEIRLDSIYSEAELKGKFGARVKLIALEGADMRTGKRVVRVYRAPEPKARPAVK